MVIRTISNDNRLVTSNYGGGNTIYTCYDNGIPSHHSGQVLIAISVWSASGEVRFGYNLRSLLISSTEDNGSGQVPEVDFALDGMGIG